MAVSLAVLLCSTRAVEKSPVRRVDLCALLKSQNLDAQAHQAATSNLNLLRSPTERQLESGIYKKGRFRLPGIRFRIENPAGTKRRQEWPELTAHYGYILGFKSADQEPMDVFIRPATDEKWSGNIYVIDQYVNGKFDEHKCMVGYDDEIDARRGYLSNYNKGWDGLHAITPMPLKQFKEWLRHGDTTVELGLTTLEQHK